MRHDPRTLRCATLALFALVLGGGCGDGTLVCTEIGCESTVVVDYGGLVLNEPYSLTINPGGATVSVTCLDDDPDGEPLPEWLSCDAGGFEITGEQAEGTTITVTLVPLGSGEALVQSALVTLVVEEIVAPNGEDCEPVCYRRGGSLPVGVGEP